MNREQVLIIGAGTHARIVYDILSEMRNYTGVIGFIDVFDNPDLKDAELDGLPVLGTGADVERIFSEGTVKTIIALGDNQLRKEWFKKADKIGFEIVSAIHPDSVVSRRTKLGRGIMVSPGVVICTGADIGDGVIVNTSASIDHDCMIGAFSHVAPGANLAGKVLVGEQSHIGIGACVRQGIEIGSVCTVGAGAAVVASVPDGVMAVGVPAKQK